MGGRVARELRSHLWDVRITGRSVPPRSEIPAAVLDLMTDGDARLDDVVRGADAIVNCVAHNENQASIDPEAARSAAVRAAARLGQAAVRLRVPRMVHLSTVHVYGRLDGDIDEDSAVAPTHPYAIAHAAAEEALRAELGESGRATIVRLSNAVGPPVRPGVDRWTLLTNDLAKTWAERGSLELQSGGTAHRDFVPLGDVCRAVHHLLTNRTSLPVVHVCSGISRTVNEIAGRMANLAETISGTRPCIYRPQAPDPPQSRPCRLSNARIRNTGFEFRDDLDDELEALLIFAQRHFQAGP